MSAETQVARALSGTFPICDYRVIVTGSREWESVEAVGLALYEVWAREVLRNIGWRLVVVHGACPTGADQFASKWARHAGHVYLSVTEEPHPAKWEEYGRKAGFIRNAEMVDAGAELCLAFYWPEAGNHGTHDTVMRAKAWGIPVKVHGKPSRKQARELSRDA